MTDFPIVVFHNPACGTSRNVVAMIRAAGREPLERDTLYQVIESPRPAAAASLA